MSAARRDEAFEQRRQGGDRRAVVVLALFLALMVFAAIRTPVPAVNEPHYLTKAKHYWDADFCRGDFFLNSADAHVVFFQTIGLFAQWFTLEQTAWIGRCLSLLLLAIGWCSFAGRLLPGRWTPLWIACLYFTIYSIGQASRELTIDESSLRFFDLSGEWLVGGVEGKVFAYAFVFWGIGLWLAGAYRRAAICGGLAISFHPVVGIWSVAAGAFAVGMVWFASILSGVRRGDAPAASAAEPETRRRGEIKHSLRNAVTVFVLLVVAALPGLIPALKFVGGGNLKLETDAAYIQVAYRLAHHLDPMLIPWTAYGSYVVLIVFWLIARRRLKFGANESWFASFVIGSILICVCGMLLGLRSGAISAMPYWEIRTRLLKFYWFRLADVMVPLAASIAVVGLLQQRLRSTKRRIAGMIFVGMLTASLFLPSPDRHPSSFNERQFADWKAACRWIADTTPAGSVFLTPTFNWGFKWYANRAEFVSYKDIPQDARGVVDWNNRLIALGKWSRKDAGAPGNYSREAIAALEKVCEEHQPGGIQYIVAVEGVFGPFDLTPVYQNETCRVYQLSHHPN